MSERANGYSAHGLCVVGIDPGGVTGVAVWDCDRQRLVHCGSGSFLEVLDLLSEVAVSPRQRAEGWLSGYTVGLAVVEDARRLPIYARHDAKAGRARDKLCRDVGRIDRDVELWVDWLSREGFAVRLAEPLRGGKWDAGMLRAVTAGLGEAWEHPTNEHARDAARLVVGVSRSQAEAWAAMERAS